MVPFFCFHQLQGAPAKSEPSQGITVYPTLSSARTIARACTSFRFVFLRVFGFPRNSRVGSGCYTASAVTWPLVVNVSFFELLDEGMISRVDCTRSGLCWCWRAAKQTQALSFTYRPIFCTINHAHFHAWCSSTLAITSSSFSARESGATPRLCTCAAIENDRKQTTSQTQNNEGDWDKMAGFGRSNSLSINTGGGGGGGLLYVFPHSVPSALLGSSLSYYHSERTRCSLHGNYDSSTQ